MNPRTRILTLTLVFGLAVGVLSASAQDQNITLPTDSVEFLLSRASFTLPTSLTGTRFAKDRTKRVPLFFTGGPPVLAKWAPAPLGGEEFNNNPRYEIATYQLQKLFLDEPDYVVPPTVARALPLGWYKTVTPEIVPTFEGTQSVLVVLQYFLYSVSADHVFDEKRFKKDSVYARHWADANLVTYLTENKDENPGNLLISTSATNPRVFTVDNGVAFRSRRSDRGWKWSRLQVDRFPHHTVDRLRKLTRDELQQKLGVLAQFALQGNQLVPVDPGENWDPGKGIRRKDGGVQLGLTEGEIGDVWDRLSSFLHDIDDGKLKVF